MKTACFTGRRPQKLPWGYNEEDERCLLVRKKLEEEIDMAIASGATHFISGMALGIDMMAAEIIIGKKKSGLPLTLEAAIPHRKQADAWTADSRERYNRILKNCDTVTFVSEYYSAYCMAKRNRYMVDKSDLVIAVTNDFTGGSGKTVLYARSRKVPVRIIEIIEF